MLSVHFIVQIMDAQLLCKKSSIIISDPKYLLERDKTGIFGRLFYLSLSVGEFKRTKYKYICLVLFKLL